MQKSNATISNLNKALRFYKGKIAVVCESKEDFENLMKNLRDLSPEARICFDMTAYEKYNDGKMGDYIPTDAELAEFRKNLKY